MKRIAIILIMAVLAGVGFGAADGVVTANDAADLEVELEDGGAVSIPAGTYDLDGLAGNIVCGADLVVTVTGPVIIDGNTGANIVVVDGTTATFTGTATNTITFTGMTSDYGFEVTGTAAGATVTMSYCIFSACSTNGFTILPTASDIVATLNTCTSTGNANDGFSIYAANRNGDVTLTLNSCISLDNGTDANDDSLTTHANSGTGVDTFIVNGGSFTGDSIGISINGATVMTMTSATVTSDGGNAVQVLGAATLDATSCVFTSVTNHACIGTATTPTGHVNLTNCQVLASGGNAAAGINCNGAASLKLVNTVVNSTSSRGVYIQAAATPVSIIGGSICSGGVYSAVDSLSSLTLYLDDVVFEDTNSSMATQGIAVKEGELVCRNCYFGPDPTANGSRIYLDTNSDSAVIENNTFYSGVRAIRIVPTPTFLSIRNNIFHTFSGNAIITTVDSIYSNVAFCNDYNLFWAITDNVLSSGTVGLNDLNETVNPAINTATGYAGNYSYRSYGRQNNARGGKSTILNSSGGTTLNP